MKFLVSLVNVAGFPVLGMAASDTKLWPTPFGYMVMFYNTKQCHSCLVYLSPKNFKKR